MKVFLAGTCSNKYVFDKYEPKYILESFFYIQEWQAEKIDQIEMFLLDSGAFTFLNSCSNKNVDWKKYIDDYCDFINKWDIKYFFELDIDSIVGHEKVKEIRNYIENRTGKKCIPVWHKSRGLEEFKKLTKEYDYIAIGEIVTKEIKRKEFPVFHKLLKVAHDNGCKVHGLGFTNTSDLHKYHFDTVDSTSWLSGGRFGEIPYFDGKIIKRHKDKTKRMTDRKSTDMFAFGEWIKFQKYAEKNL